MNIVTISSEIKILIGHKNNLNQHSSKKIYPKPNHNLDESKYFLPEKFGIGKTDINKPTPKKTILIDPI